MGSQALWHSPGQQSSGQGNWEAMLSRDTDSRGLNQLMVDLIVKLSRTPPPGHTSNEQQWAVFLSTSERREVWVQGGKGDGGELGDPYSPQWRMTQASTLMDPQ